MLLFSLTGTSIEDDKENNLSSREKKRTAFPGLCIPDETKEKRDVSIISLACVICNAFSSYLGHKRGSLCQAFLAETVESGSKNRCVIEATHVLRRKHRKD